MKALVLTGGGAKGAFQAGVLKYLLCDKDMSFDLITGVSVGALNGAFLAQYHHDENTKAGEHLEYLWKNLETKSVYKRWFPFGKLALLWKKSLFNTEPLRKLLEERISPERIKSTGKKLRVESVSIDTGERRVTTEQDPHLLKAILASAAVPFFFSPVNVVGDELDFDGGLRDLAPLRSAVRAGATHITIVSAEPMHVPHVKAKKLNAFGYLQRLFGVTVNETVKNDIDQFEVINELIKNGKEIEGKRFVEYTLIYPKDHLTTNSLEFTSKQTEEMFLKGYNEAKKTLDG